VTKVTILGTAIAISAVAATGAATERTASDMMQLRDAIRAAKPGDVIVMKNGTWMGSSTT
jgi:regulator of RNase E activity RraA